MCVDDSGLWGRGGLFTALEKISTEPRDQYELAAEVKGMITSAGLRVQLMHSLISVVEC